jgi:competence protein ComEC
VSWSGVVANLLLFPLTAVLIPAGFLVLVLSLISSTAVSLGGSLLGGLTAVLQWVALFTADMPGLARRVPSPPLWLSVAFFLVLIVLAILADQRSRWTWPAAVSLFVFCGVLTIAPFAPLLERGKLEVTALDVGQGDALFVAFPNGKTMLVDAGEGPSLNDAMQRVGLDLGESVVSAYLWSRRIQAIDVVIATHAHWDHVGGLHSVFGNFRIGELWLGPGAGGRVRDDLRELVAARSIPVRHLTAGDAISIDAVTAEVLWPPPDWIPTRNENNDSLVIRLGYGQRGILLPGDAEATVESRLLRGESALRSDVLKVSHHGSSDSTSALLLEKLSSAFAVISVGPYGQYGHPRPETIERLRLAGVRVYRTDHEGATTFRTDGNRIEVTTHRESIQPWPRFH